MTKPLSLKEASHQGKLHLSFFPAFVKITSPGKFQFFQNLKFFAKYKVK